MDGLPGLEVPGLRERKKALMRQYISDVATAMFLERGFEAVKVAEVAAACDVSEKTIYNYFPTKESLILDREEFLAARLSRVLGPGTNIPEPIDAALHVLERDLAEVVNYWRDGDAVVAMGQFQKFTHLLDSTPTLRAAQAEMIQRLGQKAAEAMAARAGMSADEPEPQMAGHALLGLWRVQFQSLMRWSVQTTDPDVVEKQVMAEVRRAARLINTGLWSFSTTVQGANRQQERAAADASNDARKQVVAALKQARDSWRTMKDEAQAGAAKKQEFEEARRTFQRDMIDAKRTFKQEIERAKRNSRSETGATRRGQPRQGRPS